MRTISMRMIAMSVLHLFSIVFVRTCEYLNSGHSDYDAYSLT
ncbi:hypothetical protein NHE_0100 [Neorickettsia helminthoeca str. Oregon]|uniref:Uncharacterized protein n=1 Tax=Neorickettsia helminthoeca str. Oregon TaxID=1286528 RepID=X5HL50_9RICK|nr:hypothetical protein NHE_0100 [Neorickettsia helminthoeca str. Oregon]